MRVGELSRRSGVSVSSIKFYLREGLLVRGEHTAPHQASYDETHLRRLALVRALIDVGGLGVAATRQVLAAVDDVDTSLHRVLGAAHAVATTVPAAPGDRAAAATRAEQVLEDLLERHGWHVSPDNPARRTVVDVLVTYELLGDADLAGVLDAYAAALTPVARDEVAVVLARDGRDRIVEGMVIGTLLGDTLLAALRRLAHEDASARYLGGEVRDRRG